MVSIRTAASFVPNNISLPSQLYTQASNFADELKKWQGIYDNYAQQEYKQQMIEKLKADSELKKQQEARSELYKQQLMDAVNNYGGDLNSPELAKRLMSIAADNGDPKTYYGIYNKFQKRQNKGQGTGTPTKQYASDRDAEIIRAAVAQSNGDPNKTEEILRNNGYPGLAKKWGDSLNKQNSKNSNKVGQEYRAKVNGNAPQQEFKASNDPEVKNISEQTAKELGLPIVGKPVYDPRTNTYYKIK